MHGSINNDHNEQGGDTEQVRQLADYITSIDLKVLPLPEEFFYASLPLCVVDAVFSIGVTYTSTVNTVVRFCERQGWTKALKPGTHRQKGKHTLEEFLALVNPLTPEDMADTLFGNRQRTSPRSGILKAEAVRRFATVLQESGINDFEDITDVRLESAEAAVRQSPGQKSGISFGYFQMLAGNDDLIKPGRMVQRFIAKAIGDKPEQVTPTLAKDLLNHAIPLLTERGAAWSARKLDYAIWVQESGNDPDA